MTDRTAQLEDEVHTLAQHALALERKIRTHEATISRVSNALKKLDRDITQTSYRPRYDEGMINVINNIRYALGETQ